MIKDLLPIGKQVKLIFDDMKTGASKIGRLEAMDDNFAYILVGETTEMISKQRIIRMEVL